MFELEELKLKLKEFEKKILAPKPLSCLQPLYQGLPEG